MHTSAATLPLPPTTAFTMPHSTTVKVPPALDLNNPTKLQKPRSRARSNSIVKVEHIGDRVEEVLDRTVYMNINADWVNAKGELHGLAIIIEPT